MADGVAGECSSRSNGPTGARPRGCRRIVRAESVVRYVVDQSSMGSSQSGENRRRDGTGRALRTPVPQTLPMAPGEDDPGDEIVDCPDGIDPEGVSSCVCSCQAGLMIGAFAAERLAGMDALVIQADSRATPFTRGLLTLSRVGGLLELGARVLHNEGTRRPFPVGACP